MIDPRHVRQVLLPQIGEAGQARIAAGTAVVASRGFAGDVEARYLAGAGVGALVVADADIAAAARDVDPRVRVEVRATEAPASFDFGARDPVAREAALGAWRAVASLRRLVAGAP